MMVIILKLVQGPRCQGCGACHRYVGKKSHLCLYCLGLKLDVDRKKGNLDSTLRQRFALLEKVKAQLREFSSPQA